MPAKKDAKLPKRVRDALVDHLDTLIETIDGKVTKEAVEGLDESDDDIEISQYGYSLGYIHCAADVLGVDPQKYIVQLADKAGLLEEDDDKEDEDA